MALRSKLAAAATAVPLTLSSIQPCSPLVAQVVRRFQLQSPLDRLKIKSRARSKPKAIPPDQRAVHVFASALLDANHHNVDLLWSLYATAKATSPGCLVRLAPLMPRFLYLLSRSYLRSDQERIVTICNDFAPLLNKPARTDRNKHSGVGAPGSAAIGSGPCVCMRDAVLGNAHNKLALVPISQCHVRSAGRWQNPKGTHSAKERELVQLCCAMKSGDFFARIAHHRILALVRLGNAGAALKVLEPYLPQYPQSPQSPTPVLHLMHDALLVETLLSHVMSGLAAQATRARSPQETVSLRQMVVQLYETYGSSILASSPRALNPALECMLELGLFEQAVTAFKTFDTSLLSATHVTTMMIGLVRAGHAQAAVTLFTSFMGSEPSASTVSKIEPVTPPPLVPDVPAVTAVIQAHLANDFNLDSALATFRGWLSFRKLPVVASLAASVPATASAMHLELDSLPGPPQSHLLAPLSKPHRSTTDLFLPPTGVTYSTLIHGLLAQASSTQRPATPSSDDHASSSTLYSPSALLDLSLALHSEMTLHEGLGVPSVTTALLVHTLHHAPYVPAVRRNMARRLLVEFFATGAAWDGPLAHTVASRFAPYLGTDWVDALMATYVPGGGHAQAYVTLASGHQVRVGVARDAHEVAWTTKAVFSARKLRHARVMRRRPAVVWETIRQREQEKNVAEWWVRAMRGDKVEEVATKVFQDDRSAQLPRTHRPLTESFEVRTVEG